MIHAVMHRDPITKSQGQVNMEDLIVDNPVTEPVTQEPANADTVTPELNQDDPLADNVDENAEPEVEEVEYKGNKYRVPKDLAPDLKNWDSLQADATRKTMAAAEIRKDFEARAESFAQEQQLNEALFAERSQLVNVESRLAQFDNVDWMQWQQQNPQAAAAASMEYLQLQNAQKALASNIDGRKAELTARQQQEIAKLNSQAIEALSKPDPSLGWDGKFDADKSQKLSSFLEKVGFTPNQIKGTNDPLMIKVAHLALNAYEQLAKQKAAATPQRTVANPVPQVGNGRSKPAVNLDNMSYKAFKAAREKGLSP
jgi:hypothetical protein